MIQFPKIIQGGMGVGVSNWSLANAVSKMGQLGVVSGTALDQLFVRRLADGDTEGHMRRGLDAFPFPEMATLCPAASPRARRIQRFPCTSARIRAS
jgi:nitronate monooxygenase